MQLKKITTFTLLAIVLIIFSLSTISAATHSITNSTSDGGIRTALNGATNGDIIELNDGTYTGTNNTNVTINKNITIQGKTKDNVILDARELSRIFIIANNTNVVFTNLTFLNGYTTTNGGAIYNRYTNSTIKFMNCTFINNAVSTYGGAIYNLGDNMAIYDCKIINSSTFNSRAGAIYNSGDNMIISGCEFTNISANNFSGTTSSYGGVIYNNGSNMAIYDCNFTNTIAYNHGGAVYNSGNNTVILGCNFINNTLYSGTGVGVFNDGINVIVSYCNFINNTGNSYGGAIRNAGSGYNLTVSYCNFTNNKGSSGGAFFSNIASNISVLYCNFINNTATINGGAIAISSGDDINISYCNFTNNSAIEYGGAIFNNGNTNISSNTMSDNVAVLGQMIYNNGTIGILNLTYLNNSTLAVLNGSTLTIYATLTDDMGNTVTGQNIRIYINGILGGTLIQNIESIEGHVSFNLTVIGEDGDLFPVNGTYDGTGEYPIIINEGLISVFTIAPFNITKIATNSTISTKNVIVGKETNITGIAKDENGNILANIELSVIVDGETYTETTNSNGEWTLTYIPTKVGNIDISVVWKGNDTHYGFTKKGTLNVAKRNIIVTITTEENDDGSITIIANATYEDNGSPVINHPVDFILDGKIIGTGITNKNGIAKLKIPANKINGKTHKITVLVQGDDKSNDGKAKTTFTIKNSDGPKSNNTNKTSNNPAAKTSAAMKKTGIPIQLIILVLLSCLGIVIRKK